MSRALDVYQQITELCEKAMFSTNVKPADKKMKDEATNIRMAITSGYFFNVCRLSKNGKSYTKIKENLEVFLHPSSILFNKEPKPKVICYHDLVLTTKEYARESFEVEAKWLLDIAPHYYKDNDIVDSSGSTKKNLMNFVESEF